MEKFFYHTGHRCSKFKELTELDQTGQWIPDTISFIDSLRVPDKLLEPWLLALKEKFGGIPLLLRFPSGFYDFHVDRIRKCAINLELNHTNSTTYFGTRINRIELNELTVLDYAEQYVLLNTAESHAVANIGKPRVIFTLGFNENTYDEVKRVIIEQR